MTKKKDTSVPEHKKVSCERSDGSTLKCLLVWGTGKCSNSCKVISDKK